MRTKEYLTWLLYASFIGASVAQTAFSTTHFTGIFAAGSQVLQSLQPNDLPTFDFSPADVFSQRNSTGNYHTGDLTFRYRTENTESWIDGDTSLSRKTLSESVSSGFLSANLGPVLGEAAKVLNMTRTWSDLDGDVALNFTVGNIASESVEVGSLGFPIEFNNIFTGRRGEDTLRTCSLMQPYIGLHGGYVQVNPLSGTGPQLVITPLGKTTKFEAWRFLPEPTNTALAYQSQTFEGLYEFQVFSKAWAEKEWKGVTPWNPPTSITLQPGASVSVGLRFSVAPSVPEIEDKVVELGLPLAVGLPGYILPHDAVGKLYLADTNTVKAITSDPEGALIVVPNPMGADKWQGYLVQPTSSTFGRTRLTIDYTNGKSHSVHYFLPKSAPETLDNLGRFLTTNQWYSDESDIFGRAPSVISYNRATNDFILQDNRAWVAGLSDEAGAGSWLAAAIKQAILPRRSEIGKLEAFVEKVVWGILQVSENPGQYGVRKSVFYYDPEEAPGYPYDESIDWNTWSAWRKNEAYLVNRAYDYVHVTALYWSLYRAGRTHPDLLGNNRTSEWHLLQAYKTVMFMMGSDSSSGAANTWYWDVGLMGETVFGELLRDLKDEGFSVEAAEFESQMKRRSDLWATQENPFGSEMAWDSTGQEGVYYWSSYFGNNEMAEKTMDSILGFMPVVAHWGWNGNAHRYWDNWYGGLIRRLERQIHHYASSLNSLPALSEYRRNPANFYMLRLGYAGNQASLTAVDTEGFGSASFHSWPDTLAWDPCSGEIGSSLLGHVLGAASYLAQHETFGWTAFGGNIVEETAGAVTVQPRDSARQRVFIAPVALWVHIDAGVIDSFTYELTTGILTLGIRNNPWSEVVNGTLVKFEQTADIEGVGEYSISTPELQEERGGWLFPLTDGESVHTLTFTDA